MTDDALLPDLRDWLGVQQGDTGASTKLAAALAASRTAVDDYCGRTFTTIVVNDTAATTRTYDGGACHLLIDDVVGDVVSVQESSDRSAWSTRTGTVTWLEPANDTVRYWLKSTTGFGRWVKVTAKFGVDQTLADRAKLPTIMWAAKLYQRHKTVSGVEGFDGFGVRITAADRDVTALLDPLCRADKTLGVA